ncbi:MAG TPA: selenocysteine-specific translation elongation factor [Pyrinomonadaceae bacterium]|nr:selenocysteine-specific translation elongation factor [Pyrinomonadaceae bacterium]
MDIIVGTAGHIDHGKTALVKALTGTDTDRLPEEKQRGITIDLGFAELELGDARFGFVDVPGHERFVKNMLAGASGIDLVLLVVAADEGIMPQTREHFDICRLLQIKNGLIAITKKDLVDDEMLDLVRAEVSEFVSGTFLDGGPIVGVSSRTGEGIDELRAALASTASIVRPRADLHIARLPIDRSFAMKGFGSVVTGTLASGKIAEGDEVELLPVGRRLRVRGVQSHGRKVSEAGSGRRTAVNLAGIDHHEISRGMLIAEPGVLQPTQSFDAEVEVLSDSAGPLRSRQRVRVHIGTAEVLARIVVIRGSLIHPGEKGFVQLRLESPATSVLGERFIIRSYSPQETIAGGSILGPSEAKVRRRDAPDLLAFLSMLSTAINDTGETLRLLVERSGDRGVNKAEVRSITGWSYGTFDEAAQKLKFERTVVDCDGVFVSTSNFEALEHRVLEAIGSMHDADRVAETIPLEKLRADAFKKVRSEVEKAVLQSLAARRQLVIDGDVVKLIGREAQLSDAETNSLAILRRTFDAAGLEVPKVDEIIADAAAASGVGTDVVRKLFQQLISSGVLVRVNADITIASRAADQLIEKVREFAKTTPDRLVDVAKFKEIAGVSRKYAIPLLEYFDQRKITARRGDKRLII